MLTGQTSAQGNSNSQPFMPSGNPLIDIFRMADRAVRSADPKPAPQFAAESQSDDVPLDIKSADDLADKFNEFSGDLDIFLALMTGIGLTIAVLSILNTMLMSVSERIIEFGILKANGWSRSDVMKLITAESATLGFAGGFCGCLLGWGLTLFVNWNWSDHIRLLASPRLLLFSLIFATVLGVAGGLYPAVWATRMMPMDAIRRG